MMVCLVWPQLGNIISNHGSLSDVVTLAWLGISDHRLILYHPPEPQPNQIWPIPKLKRQSPSIPWSTATPPHALTSGSQPSQSGLASTWCLDADWSLCWRQTNPGFWLAAGERNQSAHHPASTWRGHRPEPVKHWQLTITYPLCTASIHIIHS